MNDHELINTLLEVEEVLNAPNHYQAVHGAILRIMELKAEVQSKNGQIEYWVGKVYDEEPT